MLYIESPVGVGFSYSETGDYKCDDDRTATENLAAVESFFGMFPEFSKNKFFITGESYAGVYVPTLAEAIVNAEKAGTYTGAPLTGIAVGNGCSGTEVGICGSGPQVIIFCVRLYCKYTRLTSNISSFHFTNLGHLLRVAVPAADFVRVHGPEEQGE